MRKRHQKLVWMVALALAAAWAGDGWARPPRGIQDKTYGKRINRQWARAHRVKAPKASRAELISRSEAADIAKSQYPGKVLSVRLYQKKGTVPFYRVKVLSKGKVRVVRVDAQR